MSIYKRVYSASRVTLFLLMKDYFKRTIPPLPFFQLVSLSPQNFIKVATIISATLYNFLNYLIKLKRWLQALHLVKSVGFEWKILWKENKTQKDIKAVTLFSVVSLRRLVSVMNPA